MSRIDQTMVTISCELTVDEALALAQFMKRAGWREFRGCAVDEDEAYDIRHACDQVRDALALAGFAPR
jgi:hypothetical protein